MKHICTAKRKKHDVVDNGSVIESASLKSYFQMNDHLLIRKKYNINIDINF